MAAIIRCWGVVNEPSTSSPACHDWLGHGHGNQRVAVGIAVVAQDPGAAIVKGVSSAVV